MSDFVVVTQSHGLLPVARRLRAEGNSVYLMVWDPAYRAPLDGDLAGDPTDPDDLAWAVAQCEQGAVLVNDVPEVVTVFGRAPRTFHVLGTNEPPTSLLRLGGWFDGAQLVGHHVLIADPGPWPGGSGNPTVLGGLTCVVPAPQAPFELVEELWALVLPELKAREHQGLVQAGIGLSPTGGVALSGLTLGWSPLHTHVWLSELERLDAVLLGEAQPYHDPWLHRYTTALPVTIAPWPNPRVEDAEHSPLEPILLAPQRASQLFWHDAHRAADEPDGQHLAWVAAQRDGLIAVSVGSAHSLELARARALDTAQAIGIRGRQIRLDVGGEVGRQLAALEAAYGVCL
jgi:hypothetical protein